MYVLLTRRAAASHLDARHTINGDHAVDGQLCYFEMALPKNVIIIHISS
jgi:hypothetical protein